jgi:hypothetical protein
VQILRDRNGKLQGVIREIAGRDERFTTAPVNPWPLIGPTGIHTTMLECESEAATD